MFDLINFNYIILFAIAIFVLHGVYRGSCNSLAHTAGMGFSWLISLGIYPTLSKALVSTNLYSFMVYLTDSDKIPSVDIARSSVETLGSADISHIVEYANLAEPYSTIYENNLTNLAFADQGYTTVTDYMNTTIANVTVNIIAFLIVYLMARVIISVVINTIDHSNPFPVLKKYDAIVGGVLGGIRGFLAMFTYTLIFPVILTLASMPELLKFVTDSGMLSFFYENNFLYALISGII